MDNKTTEIPAVPVVAIVGRPNVGKSSLFNAIVGRKLAIVHEQSGVTRDRVEAEVRHDGKIFRLLDTGGLNTFDRQEKNVDFWDVGISNQAQAAMREASALIFVVDCQSGLMPLDREIALNIRALGKPVFMAVNKCDNDEWTGQTVDFAELGYSPMYPICCTHRGGIKKLLDAVLQCCPAVPAAAVRRKTALNIAVVGRPNVGKSSLINALLGTERLLTSPIAGTTRDAVKIDFELACGNDRKLTVQFVDTAGLRKKGKVDTAVETFSIMRAQSAIDRADLVIMVVESGEHSITAQDRKIAALIEKSGRSCIVAANKVDLCSGVKVEALRLELQHSLPGLNFAPAVFISAERKENLDKLAAAVAMVADNLKTEITTGVLNRVLAAELEKTPPPVVGTAPMKLFYASLAGVRPPRIKLFVNRVDAVAENYLVFLKKRIREHFPLQGIPLELEVVPRPKKIESIRRNNRKE